MAYQDLLNNLFSGGLLAQDVGLPPDVQQRAQQQALLTSGLDILANSGKRRGPRRSLAELVGSGLQAGQQGYQSGLQSGLVRQDYQGQQEARKAEQEAVQGADLTTPEGLRQVGQNLLKIGKTDRAKVYFDLATQQAKKSDLAMKVEELRAQGIDPNSPEGKKYLGMYIDPQAMKGPDPYFQAVPTPQGYMRFNARTGQMEPIMVGGSIPTPIAADPYLKQQMEAAGATGRVTGETRAEQSLAAPQAVTRADQILENIDSTLNAPGLSTATGLSSVMDPRTHIPGTSAYDAKVRIEQIKGQAFLQAFESLKGGGAITEREGQAATAAIGRLNTAQSDKEFRNALTELRGIVQRARDRQASRLPADAAMPSTSAPASEADALRRALEKYR